MAVRFETRKDRVREEKAMKAFCSLYGGRYVKLGEWDIDFRYIGEDNKTKAFIEVKGRLRPMAEAFPLPVAARKLIKLADKEMNPMLMWACEDGVIYGRLEDINGITRWGGRKARKEATNDQEVMCYYSEQAGLKMIRYTTT